MSIEELLDMMEELLEESSTLPFSSKRMVDADKMEDIINEVRLNLPEELHQAQRMIRDQKDIMDGAHREAESIVAKAEERARILVSNEAVTKAAQQRAQEIVAAAQGQARDLRVSVTDYCENMLRATNEQLVKSATEVKTLRENLRAKAKGN